MVPDGNSTLASAVLTATVDSERLSDVGVTATDADNTPRSVVRDAAVSVMPMVATLERRTLAPSGVVNLYLRNSSNVSGEFFDSTMRSNVTSSITT